MKKICALICAFFIVAMFTGCVAASVDELIKAPSLSEEQGKIIAALTDGVSGDIKLCYPRLGDNISSVYFADLNGDANDEAVIFYKTSDAESLYAHVAVLTESENGWRISASVDGPGTQVWSVDSIQMKDDDHRYLIVEWSSNNSSTNTMTVYHFTEDELITGFEDNTQMTYIDDIDGDDTAEFCSITEPTANAGYTVKVITAVDGVFETTGSFELQPETLMIYSLTNGVLADGTHVLVIDEDLGDGTYASELIAFENGQIEPIEEIDGYSVAQLSRRNVNVSTATCSEGYNTLLIPSSTPSNDKTAYPGLWTYLYKLSRNSIECKKLIYVSQEYGYYAVFPSNWYENLLITAAEDDTHRIIAIDSTTGQIRYQFQVLNVEDSDDSIRSEGFIYLTSNGMYRYYYLSNCQTTDSNFIIRNFGTY